MYMYFVKANKHVIRLNKTKQKQKKIKNNDDNKNIDRIFFIIIDGIENFDKQNKFSTTVFFSPISPILKNIAKIFQLYFSIF